MRLKKTVWIPIVGDLTFGALSYLITVADITVRITAELILGTWEIIDIPLGALPHRYRRPQWFELQTAPDRPDDLPDEWKAGALCR
jgi:hypothetical protein